MHVDWRDQDLSCGFGHAEQLRKRLIAAANLRQPPQINFNHQNFLIVPLIGESDHVA